MANILNRDDVMSKVSNGEDLSLIYTCPKPAKDSLPVVNGKNLTLTPVRKTYLSTLTDENSIFIDFSEGE